MIEDIYDPLTEYINVFCGRFKEVAQRTFAKLAEEAQVDVEANKATCGQIYDTENLLASTNTRINGWTALCAFLWGMIALIAVFIYAKYYELSQQFIIISIIVAVAFLAILLLKVHPRLKQLKSERDDFMLTIQKLKQEAWEQMAPLNKLYDWDMLTRMMSETVPRLEFDPYFTTQRLADLRHTYGWSDSFNRKRSVIYSHSGLINGNPFVICRTRKMEMGQKTYYGHKTIHWTTTERGSDGKYHTVHHSETLTASVTAPYPEYYEKTRLIYGNTAAPDLIFLRKQSGMANKTGSLSYKLKRRALRNKARDLDNNDFAMMTNEDFEIAFNTSNRNNNQQFALLFTPLAQESMLNLLKDQSVGYGDDFDFAKNQMINTITSGHMQEINLDLNPQQYKNFDFEKAQADFYSINASYFRAIYFCLAPLLCVPMYQQIRPQHDIYGHDMQRHSAFWEHEALANFWGQKHFEHPECVTTCILKTEQQEGDDGDSSVITVYAHGYRAEQRLTYISRYGGDGRWHDVPVYWDEYLPVTGTGEMNISEDNGTQNKPATQKERLERINSILEKTNLDIYRRHIASKV